MYYGINVRVLSDNVQQNGIIQPYPFVINIKKWKQSCTLWEDKC